MGCRGAGPGHCWLRPRHDVIDHRVLWRRPYLSYNLLGHLGLGGQPVLFRSLQLQGPHLCVHYHCQNRSLFRAGWGRAGLCVVAMGQGCCFSKSYLFCLSGCSFVPFLPPVLLLCFPSPPPPPLPQFLESTFAIFVFALGRVFRFISCFIC